MRDKKIIDKERFAVWGSVFFYCGLIFFLSHQPDLTLPNIVPNVDKLAHLLEYALLGWLCARAWRFERPYWSAMAVSLFALFFASIYGATDEWHQSYIPGRYADRWDWLTDICGGILGGTAFALWEKFKIVILRQTVS
jgi:VanZ family protein